MERPTPYREQPIPVQHPSGSAIKDKSQENDFEQISSETILEFLPSIHNVSKGSLDLSEFNLPINENLREQDQRPSLEVNDGCNLSINPFSSDQQLGNGLLAERQDFMHNVRNTSSQSRNILPDESNFFETSDRSLQGADISLSSHIFNKDVECSRNILSGFSSSALPFHMSHDSYESNKHFIQQDDLSKHIKSDHSLQVLAENVMPGRINDNCDKEDKNVNVSASRDTQIFSQRSPNSYSAESNINYVSNEKYSSKSDLLEHVDLVHQDTQEMEVQSSILSCTFCPKSFKTQEQLVKHEARHPYQTSAIQCSKCGEILGNYMLFQEHKQYEDYLSSCDICGQLFPNEECMMCHIRNSHNDFEDVFEDEANTPQEPEDVQDTSAEETPSNRSFGTEELLKEEDYLSPSVCEKLPSDDRNDEGLVPNFDQQPTFDLEPQEKIMDVVTKTVSTCEDPRIDQSDLREENSNEIDGPCIETAAGERSPLEAEENPEELWNAFDEQNDVSFESVAVKPQKTKCQFCSKKCSTRKSLVRHERSHPYGTAAMKCNLCLEIVENYKALKIHKKNEGTHVSCSTCNQICPNEKCLKCHVRNVHNNFVYDVKPVFVDDSNDGSYELEDEEGSDNGVPQQYSVSRFTVSDSGAPLRITIKQEKEEAPSGRTSPAFSASTPPTPLTPSPQGPPTPSPPAFVYESEPSDAENDEELEPDDSDQSIGFENKKPSRRKSSLRSTRRSSTTSTQFLLSSEESDHDESADFNYTPQSHSESEDDSDNDPDWARDEGSWGSSKKRATRRKNPLSDEDSNEDPDWGRTASSSGTSKKRGRQKKGPLSDDSDNNLDWGSPYNSSGTIKKKRKRGLLSEDDSDFDPDWKDVENPGIIKKKAPGKRGRKKKLQVAFFLPAISAPKRPRARGLGGQKAQDAAAALAQAVVDMETTAPELKTVIKPVRRSGTKASLKRYSKTFDDEYDYLLDVKREPKEGPDNPDNLQNMHEFESKGYIEGSQSNSDIIHDQVTPEEGGKITNQQEEEIVIKAEPYDFQDDDLSEGTDLYFSKKFCEPNARYGDDSSPSNKVESEADESPSMKKELRYVCKICGRALQYRSHLVRHLRRVHAGEGVEEVMRRLMKCRFCEKPYSNELSLINHEKLHDGTSKMKCNKCDERFDDKNALRRHQRKMHWEHQPVECDICKKQLSDNTCLKAHMKHMHGADEKKVTVFTCETCGRQLHTKTAFQNHVASKCGTNLLFPCETCGKSFSFKGSLKAHQLLHTGIKSFLCKFCGKAFHQKGEMKRHERKHTGEKPFICEVCGRAFAYRESLLGHSAVHTGIKPFPCKACGMRFSCSGNLVKHRRSNNCKGSAELGDNLGENAQDNLNVNNVTSVHKAGNVIPETTETPLLDNISLTNEICNLSSDNGSMQETHTIVNDVHSLMLNQAHKNKQESAQSLISQVQHINQTNVVGRQTIASQAQPSQSNSVNSQSHVSLPQQVNQTSAVSSGQAHSSQMTSVIKSGINVKPSSVLQSTSKEMKPTSQANVSQSYPISTNASNRLTGHLTSVYDRHENNMAAQSNYTSQNLVSSYNDNHFRQANQVGVNERRYSQFSMDAYAGRTDQYFDRQSLVRHEMSRQAMERAVDRQTPRFLDCFGSVQFSGVDSRNAMQSYPAAALQHPSGYPNIHSGHLGNYAAAHTVNHSGNHTNMYGSNTMMPGPVSFPGFTPNNHIGLGYAPNNPIPAHSVSHSTSYPASHMSHLEALFGHFSQNAANNNFQRLSSHNVGPPANPSLPSNHRV